MLFSADITVPIATLVTAEHVETLTLAPGVLSRIHVEFPPGCAELVGVRFMQAIHQVWPVSEGEYVAWDAGYLETVDELDLGPAPHRLEIHCVNYDSLNDHTVSVLCIVTPAALPGGQSVLDRLRGLL